MKSLIVNMSLAVGIWMLISLASRFTSNLHSILAFVMFIFVLGIGFLITNKKERNIGAILISAFVIAVLVYFGIGVNNRYM